MVGLVISGILTAAIFQLLVGQTRFARVQTAREEAQQNARVGLELITAELRGVGPAALVTAKDDSIKIASPRAWGIICDYKDDGREIMVQFPVAANRSFRTGDKVPDSVAIRNSAGNWAFLGVRDETNEKGSSAREKCNASPVNAGLPVEDPTTSRVRYFHVHDNPIPSNGEYPPGSRVYLLDWVTYDEGPASVPGTWIRRTVNGATTRPVAGPVVSGGGLQFRYRDSGGNPVAPHSQPERDRIASVALTVATRSQATFGSHPQDDSDSTTISFRNRVCTLVTCN